MIRIFFISLLLITCPIPLFADEEAPSSPAGPVEERLKALEKRLDSLEKVEVVKQVTEFVCPDGTLYDEPHDCPEGGNALERVSFRKLKFSRRESLAEKIASVVEQSQRLKLGGSARGILQGVIGTDHDDQLLATGALDLYFFTAPLPQSLLFIDIESIGGRGPDEVVGSLSRLNADADTLGVTDELKIREAWLLHQFWQDRLHLIGGKIDLTNYFDQNGVANDETVAFLNTSLVNNPLLAQPMNGPGIALLYNPKSDLGARVGVQSSDGSSRHLAQKVYAIAEVDYHAHPMQTLTGNYRLWGRSSRAPDDLSVKRWGVGVSIDQKVLPQAALFARYAVGRGAEGANDHDTAGSIGFAFYAPIRDRVRDHAGLGFSTLSTAAGTEKIVEGYYHLFVTYQFSLIANVQWLIEGPAQTAGEKNENLVIPGIRGTVNF
jgi:hypothetical protein